MKKFNKTIKSGDIDHLSDEVQELFRDAITFAIQEMQVDTGGSEDAEVNLLNYDITIKVKAEIE